MSESDENNESEDEKSKNKKMDSLKNNLEQIEFSKIINRIPEELHIYVQDKVFGQFDQMFAEFEEW